MSSWKKTFYAALAAQVCAITGFSLALPFTPFYIRELGILDDAEVARWAGNVNAAAAFTMAIFAPIWGLVADRHGRRLMVMRAMFGGALVLVLMALVQDVYQLVACRLLQGCLTGTISALLALVASETPRERTGYALGMMQTAIFVGFSLGPLAGGPIADAFGYRVTFAASAVFLLAGGLLVRYATTEAFRPPPATEPGARGTWGEVLMATGFLAALFAHFTLRFANAIAPPVFPLFVEEIYGKSPDINKVVGGILGVGGMSAALGAFLFGRVSDAWGHKRLLVGSCILSGLLAIGYAYATRIGHLWVLRALFGVGAGGILPAANAIIRHATLDRNMGKAYGITTALGSVGWAVGPMIGGHLSASQGYRSTFIVTGLALYLAAGTVRCFVRRDTPGSAAPGGLAPPSGTG